MIRTTDPIPTVYCCAEGCTSLPIDDGCPETHEHTWRCLDDQAYMDTRRWSCDCSGHKDCWKDGLVCKVHHASPFTDPLSP